MLFSLSHRTSPFLINFSLQNYSNNRPCLNVTLNATNQRALKDQSNANVSTVFENQWSKGVVKDRLKSFDLFSPGGVRVCEQSPAPARLRYASSSDVYSERQRKRSTPLAPLCLLAAGEVNEYLIIWQYREIDVIETGQLGGIAMHSPPPTTPRTQHYFSLPRFLSNFSDPIQRNVQDV